jgi:hypothetical protein
LNIKSAARKETAAVSRLAAFQLNGFYPKCSILHGFRF